MAFDNRPCFFKIFCAYMMAQELKIPQQFVKDNLKKVTANRAILTRPSGGRWAVEIWKTGQEVFLGEGWKRLVRENLMQELDFLLFKYDGDMRFTVEIFDKRGVPRSLPKDATLGSDNGLKRGRRQSEDATLNNSGRGKKNQRRPEVYQGKSTNLQNKLTSECQPGKRAVPAVREEANSFTSQFPFFKMLIKDYNVRQRSYMVNVPKSFTDKHFRKDKIKVILSSLKGKAFEVNCRAYNGKYSFGSGWRRFVDDNQLKIGDVCIFELVAEMELQVHIFNE